MRRPCGDLARVLLAGALLAAAALAPAAGHEPLSHRLGERMRAEWRPGGALVIRVEDPGVVAEQDGDTVVLRFAAPLPPELFEGFVARTAEWLQDLRYGYDSVLLLPQPTVASSVSRIPSGLALRFERRPAAAGADPDAGRNGTRLRLDRLAALVRGRGGDRLGARADLRRLMAAHPRDVQTLIDLIEQEQAVTRWREALALYDRALALSPQSSFLIAGKAGLLYDYGPRLRLDQRYTDVSDDDAQHISTLDGRMLIGAAGVLGLVVEHRLIDDPAVQSPGGPIASFNGARSFATLSWEHPGPGPGSGEVAVHAGPDRPGASVAYRLGWNAGDSSARLDLWRPYLDFVEGLVHGGYRHRAEFAHRLTPRQPWEAEFALHASRYGLDDHARIADSVGARLAASYLLFDGDPRFAAEYYFDTEYYGNVLRLDDGAGQRFEPIAFSNRELHQLRLSLSERLTDYLQVVLSGGYGIDRHNGRGRVLGAELRYAPLPGLELGLRFEQSITSARGGADRFNGFGAWLVLRP